MNVSQEDREDTSKSGAQMFSYYFYFSANVLHRVLKIDVFSFLTNDVRTVMTHVSLEHISPNILKGVKTFCAAKRGNLLTYRLMPVITIRVERERSLKEKKLF